jgi:4-hydroxybenzoyl-CoA thioesterase
MRSKTHVYNITVQFGDCDPAGIVFFPNFNRWMDQASLAFFMAQGIPPWRELVKTRGIIGTPLLEIHTKFIKTATYGEHLSIHTSIDEWSAKTFRQRHVVQRGETLICEGTEVRAFCIRDPENPDRIKAIAVPEDIKTLCTET